MPVFGQYRSIKEVAWGEDSTIFLAVPDGGNGKPGGEIAVKMWRHLDADLNAASFEASTIQKAVSESGGKHFAPVFEMGVTTEGCAWYATRRFESSVAEFLKARNTATPALLHQITADILAGLQELWRARQRPHGNLKASNVLFEGTDIRKLRAKLADPAPLPEELDSAEDLYQVGVLIYQLVRKSVRVPILHPPLDPTEDWDEFGDAWLAYSNRLLDRSANQDPGALVRLRSELPSASTGGKKLSRSSSRDDGGSGQIGGFWKVAAVVLILGGGGGAVGFKYWQDFKERTKPTVAISPAEIAKAQAFLAFARNVPFDLKDVPYLRDNVFARLANHAPDGELLSSLGDAFKKWPAKREINDAYDRYESRGWTGLQRQLQGVRGDIRLDEPLAPQLSETVAVQTRVDLIESEWKLVEQMFTGWQESGSRELLRLQEWTAVQMKTKSDLTTANEEIVRLRDRLSDVDQFAATDEWRIQIVQSRFRAESEMSRRLLSPEEWKAEARKYRRQEEPDTVRKWEGAIAELDTFDDKLSTEEREELRKRRGDFVVSDADYFTTTYVALLDRVKPKPVVPPPTAPMTAANTPPPAGLPTPLPPDPPKVDDAAPLRSWLVSLSDAARSQTSVTSFLPIFQKQVGEIGVAGNSEGARQAVAELSGLLKPPEPPLPNLSGDWKLAYKGEKPGQNFLTIYRYTVSKDKINAAKDVDVLVPFVLIREPAPFYMAGVELPVGMARQAKPELFTRPIDGPNAWEPVGEWKWGTSILGRIGNARKSRGPDQVAPAFYVAAAPPLPNPVLTPMNSISGTDADSLARTLGCEIPTLDQWKAGLNAKAMAAARAPKLRNAAWLAQFNYCKTLAAEWKAAVGNTAGIPWPDTGSYTSDQLGPERWDGAAAPELGANSADEDKANIWFRTIYSKQEDLSVLNDMVGNVAEWVADGSGGSRKYQICGGSAISDPRKALEPVSIENGQAKKFSDVGVRLVAKLSGAIPNDELAAFRDKLAQLIELKKPTAAVP